MQIFYGGHVHDGIPRFWLVGAMAETMDLCAFTVLLRVLLSRNLYGSKMERIERQGAERQVERQEEEPQQEGPFPESLR